MDGRHFGSFDPCMQPSCARFCTNFCYGKAAFSAYSNSENALNRLRKKVLPRDQNRSRSIAGAKQAVEKLLVWIESLDRARQGLKPDSFY